MNRRLPVRENTYACTFDGKRILETCQHKVSRAAVARHTHGEQAHTLSMQELTQHTHTAQVRTANATTGNPANNFLAGVASFGYRNNLSNLRGRRSGTFEYAAVSDIDFLYRASGNLP
jgi:microcystin-dependent protein